jgi:hypothetical protein
MSLRLGCVSVFGKIATSIAGVTPTISLGGFDAKSGGRAAQAAGEVSRDLDQGCTEAEAAIARKKAELWCRPIRSHTVAIPFQKSS